MESSIYRLRKERLNKDIQLFKKFSNGVASGRITEGRKNLAMVMNPKEYNRLPKKDNFQTDVRLSRKVFEKMGYPTQNHSLSQLMEKSEAGQNKWKMQTINQMATNIIREATKDQGENDIKHEMKRD